MKDKKSKDLWTSCHVRSDNFALIKVVEEWVCRRSATSLNILRIKSGEELVIRTAVYPLKGNKHADPDVKFAAFVFRVGATSDITGVTLELNAQLLLGEIIIDS